MDYVYNSDESSSLLGLALVLSLIFFPRLRPYRLQNLYSSLYLTPTPPPSPRFPPTVTTTIPSQLLRIAKLLFYSIFLAWYMPYFSYKLLAQAWAFSWHITGFLDGDSARRSGLLSRCDWLLEEPREPRWRFKNGHAFSRGNWWNMRRFCEGVQDRGAAVEKIVLLELRKRVLDLSVRVPNTLVGWVWRFALYVWLLDLAYSFLPVLVQTRIEGFSTLFSDSSRLSNLEASEKGMTETLLAKLQPSALHDKQKFAEKFRKRIESKIGQTISKWEVMQDVVEELVSLPAFEQNSLLDLSANDSAFWGQVEEILARRRREAGKEVVREGSNNTVNEQGVTRKDKNTDKGATEPTSSIPLVPSDSFSCKWPDFTMDFLRYIWMYALALLYYLERAYQITKATIADCLQAQFDVGYDFTYGALGKGRKDAVKKMRKDLRDLVFYGGAVGVVAVGWSLVLLIGWDLYKYSDSWLALLQIVLRKIGFVWGRLSIDLEKLWRAVWVNYIGLETYLRRFEEVYDSAWAYGYAGRERYS